MHHDDVRREQDVRDRREVLERVPGQRLEEMRVAGVIAGILDEQRVAIGLRPRHLLVPMFPLAPGLFSTTTGWPSAFASGSETSRAARSVEPPGEAGTIMVTGREG